MASIRPDQKQYGKTIQFEIEDENFNWSMDYILDQTSGRYFDDLSQKYVEGVHFDPARGKHVIAIPYDSFYCYLDFDTGNAILVRDYSEELKGKSPSDVSDDERLELYSGLRSGGAGESYWSDMVVVDRQTGEVRYIATISLGYRFGMGYDLIGYPAPMVGGYPTDIYDAMTGKLLFSQNFDKNWELAFDRDRELYLYALEPGLDKKGKNTVLVVVDRSGKVVKELTCGLRFDWKRAYSVSVELKDGVALLSYVDNETKALKKTEIPYI